MSEGAELIAGENFKYFAFFSYSTSYINLLLYRQILVIVINETRSCLLDAQDKGFIV